MRITIDGLAVELKDRAQRIILHVIDAQDDLEIIPVGKFCVDFSGRGTQPFLTKVYRSAKVGAKAG